ncbi:MAG: DUF5615 family PIN-like protein [Caulobacterales bacterium]|uniref:DUF5615 family PIN-like protein n=1 Tax=Glycocaulis sp. TaxID=1969725 RepID=UPI003FA16F8F
MTGLAFLVDVHLPPALARWLSDQRTDAVHALDLGLERASDTKLCEQAVCEGRIVITKDADFLNLSLRYEPAVRVLWVRVGNMATIALIARIAQVWPQIRTAFEDGETIVELR